MKRRDLVTIYFSNDEQTWPLPVDLLYLILEISGMAKYGSQCSLFTIYFRPGIKWRERRRRRAAANEPPARGIST